MSDTMAKEDRPFIRYPVTERVPTAGEVIERARALRPLIREEAGEAERRGYYSARLNDEFSKAGFHRLLQPRKFGGYEFDVTSYYKVMIEIATGDPGTAWCLALGTSVGLYVSSFLPPDVQEQVFRDGPDFIGPFVGTPELTGGTAVRVEDGYLVKGKWRYSSGVPYSNWFLGTATVPGENGKASQSVTVLVPKGGYTMLDDWGDLLGQRASGSNSVVIDGTIIPNDFVFYDAMYGEGDENLTPGGQFHDNPMYNGKFVPFGAGVLACTQVGAARAALEEYERIIRSSRPRFANNLYKYQHHDWQRIHGLALSMTNAAEALLLRSGKIFMEHCRMARAGEKPFDMSASLQLLGLQHQVSRLAWDAGLELFRSAGSSAAVNGHPMQRYFRDLATYRSNANHQMDFTATRIGQAALGLQPDG